MEASIPSYLNLQFAPTIADKASVERWSTRLSRLPANVVWNGSTWTTHRIFGISTARAVSVHAMPVLFTCANVVYSKNQ
jgi:hypothetical protein